jgi:hypothetical protein
MPDFRTDIDIDPQDFYDECSEDEKQELIDILVDDNLVIRLSNPTSNPSTIHTSFLDDMQKIQSNYFRLSIEDLEFISQIAKKY